MSLLLLGGILLSGCDKGSAPPEVRTGAQLYGYYCAECHQISGDGAFLRGIPPVRHTSLTYRELVARILGHNQPKGSKMPAFDVNKSQAESIAIHIRRQLKAE